MVVLALVQRSKCCASYRLLSSAEEEQKRGKIRPLTVLVSVSNDLSQLLSWVYWYAVMERDGLDSRLTDVLFVVNTIGIAVWFILVVTDGRLLRPVLWCFRGCRLRERTEFSTSFLLLLSILLGNTPQLIMTLLIEYKDATDDDEDDNVHLVEAFSNISRIGLVNFLVWSYDIVIKTVEMYGGELSSSGGQHGKNESAHLLLQTIEGGGDGHKSDISGIAKLGREDLLTTSWDTSIKQWNLVTGQCLATFNGHNKSVSALEVIDAQTFVSVSQDRTAKLWTTSNGGRLLKTFGPQEMTLSCVIKMGSGMFLTGSFDGSVKLWNVDTTSFLKQYDAYSSGGDTSFASRQEVAITSMARLSDETFVAVSKDCFARIWHVTTAKLLRSIGQAHERAINDVCCHMPDRSFVTVGDDKLAKLWDRNTGACVRTYKGHSDAVLCCTVMFTNKDMALLLTGSKDGTAKVWGLAEGNSSCLQTYKCPTPVRSVAVMENMYSFATGSAKGLCQLWMLPEEYQAWGSVRTNKTNEENKSVVAPESQPV